MAEVTSLKPTRLCVGGGALIPLHHSTNAHSTLVSFKKTETAQLVSVVQLFHKPRWEECLNSVLSSLGNTINNITQLLCGIMY